MQESRRASRPAGEYQRESRSKECRKKKQKCHHDPISTIHIGPLRPETHSHLSLLQGHSQALQTHASLSVDGAISWSRTSQRPSHRQARVSVEPHATCGCVGSWVSSQKHATLAGDRLVIRVVCPSFQDPAACSPTGDVRALGALPKRTAVRDDGWICTELWGAMWEALHAKERQRAL